MSTNTDFRTSMANAGLPGHIGVWWVGPVSDPLSDESISSDLRMLESSPSSFTAKGAYHRVFRERGLARVEVGPKWIEIAFDLDHIAPDTIERVCGQLENASAGPGVRLRYCWSGAWMRKDFDGPVTAARAMRRITDWQGIAPFRDAFTETDDPDSPPRTMAGMTAQLAWRGVRKDSGAYIPLIHLLGPTSALFGILDHGYRILNIGPSSGLALVFGRDWARHARGLPGTPDSDHDCAVSRTYRAVFQSGTIHRDRMTARIKTIYGPEPIWLHYERSLIPFEMPDGSPAVLSATQRLPYGPGPGPLAPSTDGH